jgi:hypothetical protein
LTLHQIFIVRVIFLLYLMEVFVNNPVYSQNVQSISVTENYIFSPLKNILLDLESTYRIPFYYKGAWIPEDTLNFEFQETPLSEVMNSILANTQLSFAILNGRSIIIAQESRLKKELSEEYFIDKDRRREYYNNETLPANLEIINLGKSDARELTENHTITGTVTDQLRGDSLTGASIFLKDLDIAFITDINGRFRFYLSGGTHLIEFRMVGYETKIMAVNLLGSVDWSVQLLPEATELDEIRINATADDHNVKSSLIGYTKLSPVELREMPTFLGEPDVIKSILTLPGVSTVGEGASGFNVRGGNIDQNLIMQDHALIFNSSHAMGFFSIFNPDAIKEVNLYKGHIPAQYGGRVSSVLDVQLKSNNYDTFKANGGLGMLASRLTIETPLIKDQTSILLGGRVAYSDWVLNFVNNPDVRSSSLAFYDFNTKISQRLGENGNLWLSYYHSHDKFDYSDEFGFSWDINTLSFNWDQMIAPGLHSEFSGAYSEARNTTFQPSGIDGFTLGNGMRNYKLKEDLLITKWVDHSINVGVELNLYNTPDEILEPYNSNSTVLPASSAKDNGVESAVYFNDAFEMTPNLAVSFGVRYSRYYQVGPSTVYQYENEMTKSVESIVDSLIYDEWEKVASYYGIDPRVSLRYTLTSNSSIKMSYNRLNQYIHLISNTTAALPIDYWQVSNTFFKPLRAHNFSLGYFRNFRLNQWETSLEAYYRDLENIIDYKDFPDLFLNNHLETELLSGVGQSYGLEFFIKKKSGKFNGWLSYTFSRTFIKINDEVQGEKINRGEWYPSKFDQPHNLSIVGNININKTNQLSFNFTYTTGRPLTAPDNNYGLDDYIVPGYSERNRYRIPDFHRLDVSYTLQRGLFRTHKYKDSFTLSLYNLYARKNAYSIYFKRDRRNVFGAYKLSVLGTILPSITYNFHF